MNILPPVPVIKTEAGEVIQVAEKWKDHINVEQPDLYAVYPFRLFTLGTDNLNAGRFTFEHPSFSETTQQSYRPMPFIRLKDGKGTRSFFSWHQTGVQAAYLGLTDYAREILVRSALSNDNRFSFPTFYGPNYDWIPDGDHLAIINATLQSMLLQCEGNTIRVLPAWPKEWDVKFKLHGFNNTVVEGVFEKGKFVRINAIPTNRKKDLEFSIPTLQ